MVVVIISVVNFGCVGTSDWQKKDNIWWDNKVKVQNEKASELLSKGMYKEVAATQWIQLSDSNKIKTLSLMNDEYKPNNITARFKTYIKSLKETRALDDKQVEQAKTDLSLSNEYTSSYIVNIMSTSPTSRSINPGLASSIDNLKRQHSLLDDLLLDFSIKQYQLYGINTNAIFKVSPTASDVDNALIKANDGDLFELKLYAEQGNALAQNGIGMVYDKNGKHKESSDWFKLAAKNGNAYSQVLLAQRYTDNTRGLKEDWSKAFYWFKEAAKQGYPYAQNMTASLYCSGIGVKPNYDKAYEWYKKAISQGSEEAKIGFSNMDSKCLIFSKPSKNIVNKIKREKQRQEEVAIKNNNVKPSKSEEEESNLLSDAWGNLNKQVGQNSWDTKLYRLGEALSNMGTPYSQRGVAPSYRWMADEPDSGFSYSDYNRMSEQNKTDRKIKELEKQVKDSTFGYMSGNQMYSKSNKYMGYIKSSNLYNEHGQKTGYIRGNSIYSNSGKYLGYTR